MYWLTLDFANLTIHAVDSKITSKEIQTQNLTFNLVERGKTEWQWKSNFFFFLKARKEKCGTGRTNRIMPSFHDFGQHNWTQFIPSLYQVSETPTPLGNLTISDTGTFVVGVHENCAHVYTVWEENLRMLNLGRQNREIRPTSCWLHNSIQLIIADKYYTYCRTHKLILFLFYSFRHL